MVLRVEILHWTYKTNTLTAHLNTFRSYISESSVARSSQVLGSMTEMLTKVDMIAHVKKPSGKHIGPIVEKDFEAILKVLLSEQVFRTQEGHIHTHFTNFSCDPLSSLIKAPMQFQDKI